jgi:hypothetical protein
LANSGGTNRVASGEATNPARAVKEVLSGGSARVIAADGSWDDTWVDGVEIKYQGCRHQKMMTRNYFSKLNDYIN